MFDSRSSVICHWSQLVLAALILLSATHTVSPNTNWLSTAPYQDDNRQVHSPNTVLRHSAIKQQRESATRIQSQATDWQTRRRLVKKQAYGRWPVPSEGYYPAMVTRKQQLSNSPRYRLLKKPSIAKQLTKRLGLITVNDREQAETQVDQNQTESGSDETPIRFVIANKNSSHIETRRIGIETRKIRTGNGTMIKQNSSSGGRTDEKRIYDRETRRNKSSRSGFTAKTMRVPLHVLPALPGARSPDWPTQRPEVSHGVNRWSSTAMKPDSTAGRPALPTAGWTSLVNTRPATTTTDTPTTKQPLPPTESTSTPMSGVNSVGQRPLFSLRPRPPIIWPLPTQQPEWGAWPQPSRSPPSAAPAAVTPTDKPALVEIAQSSSALERPAQEHSDLVCVQRAADGTSQTIQVDLNTGQYSLTGSSSGVKSSSISVKSGKRAQRKRVERHGVLKLRSRAANSSGNVKSRRPWLNTSKSQLKKTVLLLNATGLSRTQTMARLASVWSKASRDSDALPSSQELLTGEAAAKYGGSAGNRRIVCVVWRESGEAQLAPLPDIIKPNRPGPVLARPTRQPFLSTPSSSSLTAAAADANTATATTTSSSSSSSGSGSSSSAGGSNGSPTVPSISQAVGSLSDALESAVGALTDSTSSQLQSTMLAVDQTAVAIGSSVKQYIGTSIPSITLVTTVGVPIVVALLALLGAPPLLLSAISVSSPLMLQGLATLYNSLPSLEQQQQQQQIMSSVLSSRAAAAALARLKV